MDDSTVRARREDRATITIMYDDRSVVYADVRGVTVRQLMFGGAPDPKVDEVHIAFRPTEPAWCIPADDIVPFGDDAPGFRDGYTLADDNEPLPGGTSPEWVAPTIPPTVTERVATTVTPTIDTTLDHAPQASPAGAQVRTYFREAWVAPTDSTTPNP